MDVDSGRFTAYSDEEQQSYRELYVAETNQQTCRVHVSPPHPTPTSRPRNAIRSTSTSTVGSLNDGPSTSQQHHSPK